MARRTSREVDPEEDEDLGVSPRELARRKVRSAGRRSGDASRALLQLPEPAFQALKIDDDVREAASDARAIKSHVARRRAERRLANFLRHADMTAVWEALNADDQHTRADAQNFQLAEQWRARLIEGEPETISEWLTIRAGLDSARWRHWVAEAQAERSQGKPRGAGRQLFRQIMAVLRQEAEDIE